MKIERLTDELKELSFKVDLVGHDQRIHLLSDLSNRLKDKPITTATGDWNANEIVLELDKLAIGETECGHQIDDMILHLKEWE